MSRDCHHADVSKPGLSLASAWDAKKDWSALLERVGGIFCCMLEYKEGYEPDLGLLSSEPSSPPFPYLEAVVLFNLAVYICHTYLDVRQLKVPRCSNSFNLNDNPSCANLCLLTACNDDMHVKLHYGIFITTTKRGLEFLGRILKCQQV